jgi:hypothetical protein
VFISHVDSALERLVRVRLGLTEDVGDVSVATPDKDWAARQTRITVNLFLYAVHRSAEPSRSPTRPEGGDPRRTFRRPQPMVQLSYLVSAWAGGPRDEHQLLGDLVSMISGIDVLPAELAPAELSSSVRLALGSRPGSCGRRSAGRCARPCSSRPPSRPTRSPGRRWPRRSSGSPRWPSGWVAMVEPRLLVAGVALAALAPALSACSLFGDDDAATSVFDAEPGMCFQAPGEVVGHDQEAYAVVPYTGEGDAYPGDDELAAFADGRCAQEFRDYVGVDYLDSSLYFTYLVPSPRSWEQDDRDVLCLVTNAGEPLEGSVEGSER